MEHHICTWLKENSDKSDEIGELIIDGNLVEFYSRFHGEIFPSTYIGRDGDHYYKVFVNGGAKHSERKTLDYSNSHRVLYVLKQNFKFLEGNDISGIIAFSFEIPELIGWIGRKTVLPCISNQDTLGAVELKMDPIILKQSSPHIEIRPESKSFSSSIYGNESVSRIIKSVPRIFVDYGEKVDVETLVDDINCLMQFFGLLIGTVRTADEIRLSVEGEKQKSWLYINRDFSYNQRTQSILDKPRTYYYVLEDMLENIMNLGELFIMMRHMNC